MRAEVGVVVAGMDLTFTYSKSALAGIYCQKNKGCFLLSTNQDHTFPAEDGLFLPGAGATIAHVSASCQMEAKNVGKPESVMFSAIRSRYPDLDLSGVLMVGDRFVRDGRLTRHRLLQQHTNYEHEDLILNVISP